MELRYETVSQASNEESVFNPVELYAGIVRRIKSYPNVSDKWPIFTLFGGSSFSKISGRDILRDIWLSVDFIGEYSLGFTSADVGTHYVCASLSMMMFISIEPTYIIMPIGIWSSDALLAYIEKQIKEFTKGVSSRMLINRNFYNTPLPATREKLPRTIKEPATFIKPTRVFLGDKQALYGTSFDLKTSVSSLCLWCSRAYKCIRRRLLLM